MIRTKPKYDEEYWELGKDEGKYLVLKNDVTSSGPLG